MRALFVAGLWLATGCACGGEELAIADADGAALLTVCADVARTEADRMTGLRGRDALAPGEGLLLAFPIEDEICIVNDGVRFDIDAAYAGNDGVITAIERRIPAGDPTPRCHPATQQVLEMAAGQLADAMPGDRIL